MIREQIILKLIQNKDILDIGSIGQTDSYSLWNLYKNSKCRSLTGIDLPESKEIVKKYFKIDKSKIAGEEKIVFGNMETYNFNREFDVIVAGDVLEHVDNQGLFLSNIKKHLREDGILILTTPNAKWLTALLPPNPTHKLWHDRYTLACMLDNCGLKIQKFRYYYGNKPHYNPFMKLVCLRQNMLVICQYKKSIKINKTEQKNEHKTGYA